MELRYGINPDQVARASLGEPGSPMRLVSGEPSYINLLDALHAWQLVHESARALDAPVATSFKHVSPAGAARAGAVDEVMEATWAVNGADLSPVASAYVRARDGDPKSSFSDLVAVSEPVDRSLASVLTSVVSDGIVAPGFEPGTAALLARKKQGRFLVLEASTDYEPPAWEQRDVFGVRLEQQVARTPISWEVVSSGAPVPLPDAAVDDLLLAMITARYTQSNSVTYAKAGMTLGVGAGQQSRIDCTKLAGAKVDTWWLRRHEKVRSLAFKPAVRRQARINWQIRFIEADISPAERERFLDAVDVEPRPITDEDRAEWLAALDDVVLASDGYIPFRDNIDHASRHGVRWVAEPGGSARSPEVREAGEEHGITLVSTGVRLFHH